MANSECTTAEMSYKISCSEEEDIEFYSDQSSDEDDSSISEGAFTKGDNYQTDTEDEAVEAEQEALESPITEPPANCVIHPNEYIKIKKWWAVTNEASNSKSDNILRGSVNDIMEYLTSKKKVIGVEEVSARGADQHVRLFLDLDKVPNFKKEAMTEILNAFVKLFAQLFIQALTNEYKTFNIEVYNELTVQEICDGAAIAIKDTTFGLETGVHIYFTNIVTHLASFKHVKEIIKNIKSTAILNFKCKAKYEDYTAYGIKPDQNQDIFKYYDWFKYIDEGLYKDKPNIRSLRSLKENYSGDPYVKLTENKKDSDFFFTFIPQTETVKYLHFEVKSKITNKEKGQQVTFSGKELEDLISLIDVSDSQTYSIRNLVCMVCYMKEDITLDLKTVLEKWYKANNRENKFDAEVTKNWERWERKHKQFKVGYPTLMKLAEESNPNGYSIWCDLYKKGRKKSLFLQMISNFTHKAVADYFAEQNEKDFIYNNGRWFIFNHQTKLWEEKDSFKDLLATFIIQKLQEMVEDLREEVIDLKLRIEELKASFEKEKSTRKRKELENSIQTFNGRISSREGSKKDDKKKKSGYVDLVYESKKKIEDVNFCGSVIQFLKEKFTRSNFKFNSNTHLISFRNKVFDLNEGIARERKPEDYITKALELDYEENNQAIQEITNWIKSEIFVKQYDDFAEEILMFFGYCLTGLMEYRTNILFCKGVPFTAKSTIANIFRKCLPIYFTMFGQEVFNLDNKNWDKEMMTLYDNPIRLAFVDEMKRTHLDIDRLKTFTEGVLNVKPLYRHAVEFNHQCKLYLASNHEYTFKPANAQGVDKGIMRRGLYVETKYEYLPPLEYQQKKEIIEKSLLKYKKNEKIYGEKLDKRMKYIREADEKILNKFNTPLYQLAFIHLLISYAKQAFESLSLPLLRNAFKSVCTESDRMQKLIDDYYVITNDDKDRISKAELKRQYEYVYDVKINEETILSEGKRCGLTYERQKRKNGIQGVFVGICRKKEITQSEDSDGN